VYFQSPELAASFAGRARWWQRMGNADRVLAPHGVYRCLPDDTGDRYVAIPPPVTTRTGGGWPAELARDLPDGGRPGR